MPGDLLRNADDIPGSASGLGRSGFGNGYCPSDPIPGDVTGGETVGTVGRDNPRVL